MPLDLSNDPQIYQTVITLAILTVLFVLDDRRLIIVPLMLQYVLISALISPELYGPISIIRITLGLAISAILYVTASHIEHAFSAGVSDRTGESLKTARMSFAFRLLTLGLSILLAFGIWSSYILPGFSPSLSLTSFWLISVGILLALISTDPFHMGLSLLVCMSGFGAIYLFLEQSILVAALFGLVEIAVAFAVAYFNENWLDVTIERVSSS